GIAVSGLYDKFWNYTMKNRFIKISLFDQINKICPMKGSIPIKLDVDFSEMSFNTYLCFRIFFSVLGQKRNRIFIGDFWITDRRFFVFLLFFYRRTGICF